MSLSIHFVACFSHLIVYYGYVYLSINILIKQLFQSNIRLNLNVTVVDPIFPSHFLNTKSLMSSLFLSLFPSLSILHSFPPSYSPSLFLLY